MSLQLHLPLLGDLRNNGLLGDATVTNHGATVNDSGKLGKCYAFNGSQYITVNNPLSANTPEFSIAAWVYFTDVTDYYATIYCARTATGGAGIVAYIYNSDSNKYLLRFDDGATYQEIYNLPKNQWVHLVFVRTRTGKAIYVNGVSVMGTTTVGNLANISTTAMIGNDQPSMAHGLKGRLNDVRVYDHRISDREIKELAKGLVAHWKLDDLIGNENLLPQATYGISHWSHINTTCTEVFEDGYKNQYHLITAKGGVWENVYSPAISVTAGQTYTLSADITVEQEFTNNYSAFGLCIVNAVPANGNPVNATIARIYTGNTTTGTQPAVTTVRKSVTFTPTTSTIYLNIPGGWITDGQSDLYFDFDNLKLELGDTATSWLPARTDAMYSDWEYDKAHDSSGYCHDGTFSTNPPAFDKDSARYSGCMKFVASSQNSIDCGVDTWLPTDEISVSWWGYMDAWGTTRPISCTESGGWNFEQGDGGGWRFPVNKRGSGYIYSTPVKKWTDYTSGWHFFVGTFDGYVSRIYVDGELDSTSTNGSPEVKAAIAYNQNAKLFLGCEAYGANPSSPYFNGKLSDIRIYATALSDDDIKELYAASASIDDRHNVYARELVEV